MEQILLPGIQKLIPLRQRLSAGNVIRYSREKADGALLGTGRCGSVASGIK